MRFNQDNTRISLIALVLSVVVVVRNGEGGVP